MGFVTALLEALFDTEPLAAVVLLALGFLGRAVLQNVFGGDMARMCFHRLAIARSLVGVLFVFCFCVVFVVGSFCLCFVPGVIADFWCV